MSIPAEVLDALVAAGATSDMIVSAIRADQAIEERRRAEKRAKDAERKRRSRERHAASQDVTRKERDGRGQGVTARDPSAPPSSPSDGFPTPLPITTPSSPPPPAASLRSADARARDDWPADYREQFWQQFPNRVGKHAAMVALDRVRRDRVVSWADLVEGLARYCAKTDDRPWCNPATWLNQHRWTDEPATVSRGPPRQPTFDEIADAARAYSNGRSSDESTEPFLDLAAEPGPGVRSGSR